MDFSMLRHLRFCTKARAATKASEAAEDKLLSIHLSIPDLEDCILAVAIFQMRSQCVPVDEQADSSILVLVGHTPFFMCFQGALYFLPHSGRACNIPICSCAS
jgi:hypothetical protein